MNDLNSHRDAIRNSTTGGIDVRALGSYWPVVAVLVPAVIIRSFIWLNADVSWLLTLGEQVLRGARAYVDFTEPNPPASILIYMPAILLGQFIGITAESMVAVLVFADVFLCLWIVGRVLSGSALIQSREKPAMFAVACALLLILPGDNFAERENIALIAILPMLAVYAVRASGSSVNGIFASVAGIGGGIAVAIKPYFALALILPLPYVLWKLRTHQQKMRAAIFSPEHFAGGLVVLVYGVVLLWYFSDYVHHTLPLVLTLYVPLRYSLLLMMANPSVILLAMATLVGLGLGISEFRNPFIAVASLAALGFAGALVIQGKGWPYHGYPAVALALLALSFLLIRLLFGFLDRHEGTKSPSLDLAFGAALFALIYTLESIWLLQEPSRAKLVAEVARLVPAHPKVFSIYGAPGLAFPLTRKLQGTPIGRTPFQWISTYTNRLLTVGELDPAGRQTILDPATRRRIEEYARMDRSELADTIRTRRPDVILIGGKVEKQWAFSHPEIAAVLGPYHQVETMDEIEIWLPRNVSRPVSP